MTHVSRSVSHLRIGGRTRRVNATNSSGFREESRRMSTQDSLAKAKNDHKAQLHQTILSLLRIRLPDYLQILVPMTHNQIASLLVAAATEDLSVAIDYATLFLPNDIPCPEVVEAYRIAKTVTVAQKRASSVAKKAHAVATKSKKIARKR